MDSISDISNCNMNLYIVLRHLFGDLPRQVLMHSDHIIYTSRTIAESQQFTNRTATTRCIKSETILFQDPESQTEHAESSLDTLNTCRALSRYVSALLWQFQNLRLSSFCILKLVSKGKVQRKKQHQVGKPPGFLLGCRPLKRDTELHHLLLLQVAFATKGVGKEVCVSPSAFDSTLPAPFHCFPFLFVQVSTRHARRTGIL